MAYYLKILLKSIQKQIIYVKKRKGIQDPGPGFSSFSTTLQTTLHSAVCQSTLSQMMVQFMYDENVVCPGNILPTNHILLKLNNILPTTSTASG